MSIQTKVNQENNVRNKNNELGQGKETVNV